MVLVHCVIGRASFQGRSGTCLVATCPNVGKFYTRLDNHLSIHHSGISIAENDNMRHGLQGRRSRPLVDKRVLKTRCKWCHKNVIHLTSHIKNMHNTTLDCYLKRKVIERVFASKQTEYPKRQEELKEFVKEIQREQTKSERNAARIQNTTVMTDGISTCSRAHVNDYPVKIVEVSEGEEDDMKATREDFQFAGSKETLRFLIHNLTPFSLKSFLMYVERESIASFIKSDWKKCILPDADESFLLSVYSYRHYCVSYYLRASESHPLPTSEMIHKCIACGVKERGLCECPILPKSFYIYCRHSCAPKLKCEVCPNYNNTAQHDCFDFFHCKVCSETYSRRTRN